MKHLHRYLIALTVVLAIVKFAFYPPYRGGGYSRQYMHPSRSPSL